MGAVVIKFEGVPVAKGRPKFAGKFVYTPAKTRAFEAAFRDAAIKAMKGAAPSVGAVRVTVEAMMPVAKSLTPKRRYERLAEYHAIRPDLDNITKAATDAMNGVVYNDDCQIAELLARKKWGAHPSLTVTVEPL